MRRLRSFTRLALTVSALAGASRAGAQALGPQRQFLAIEPYYEFTRLDVGSDDVSATSNMNGYGARLWINGAPFHFPVNSAIALFMTYSPGPSAQSFPQGDPVAGGFSVLHYGVQVDQFFVRRPLGGVIDPFVSIGVGAYRYGFDQDVVAVGGTSETHLALSPGGGIRIPLPNRFELRGDVRDLIVVNGRTNTNGSQQTTNNLVVQAGVGVTF